VAEPDQLESVAQALVTRLADGPTLSFAATRTLLKTWSSGGVAGADVAMLDITMGLYVTEDAIRGFANTAEAFDRDEEPGDLVFYGK
jgi:enoyl-CoA hydratase/carnithine racemase